MGEGGRGGVKVPGETRQLLHCSALLRELVLAHLSNVPRTADLFILLSYFGRRLSL